MILGWNLMLCAAFAAIAILSGPSAAAPDLEGHAIAADDGKAAVEAVESDNPHDVNFKDRTTPKADDANAAWRAAESDNPHSTEFGRASTPSKPCTCKKKQAARKPETSSR
jgi:hypothetical protein